MKSVDIRIEQIVSEAFEENCYLVYLDGRPDCVVIDPGLDPEPIIERIERLQRIPAMILNTHGHADHIGGNAVLKQRWPEAQLVIGEHDAPLLTDAVLNLSKPFGFAVISPAADRTLADGEAFSAAGIDFRAIEIPGHTAGEVVFVCDGQSPITVFVGDVIFAGSVGRTDFPGGSFEELAAGIRQKLFTLPDDTILLSGHGPETTVGQEKRYNPFVGQRA